jgi:hypothetical protein
MDCQLVVDMEHEEFEHDNWDGLRMKEETLGQRLGWLVRMNLRTRYAARRIPWKKACNRHRWCGICLPATIP